MAQNVGKSVRRLDGYDKVTGKTQYLDDIDIPGCWYATALRSDIPYGKIKKITYDTNFNWDQVVTCDYKDIPGLNRTTFLTQDQLILADDTVRHPGEAIILIAAPTKELAEEAKKNIQIDFEELTPVLTIDESKKKENIIWGDDNIQSKYHIIKGDIQKGFEEADFIVEDRYETGFHEHLYIEPNAIAALPREDGGIMVMGSLQCPYYVLKSLKIIFDCDETKINVRQTPMGGAFGGKEDYPSLTAAYVALLTKKSGKPVKMVYSREEDIQVTTKRHPSVMTHKTGVKKDGTLTAMQIDVDFEGGAYSTMSPVVLSRGVIHAAGPYKCEHVESKAQCYATNKVPSGAYRGFGVPQTCFAMEMHLDKVAETIGMTPAEIRAKNCVHVGDTLSTTQKLRESVAAETCLNKALEETNFTQKWQEYKNQEPKNNVKKGIGISLYMHGGAFTGSGEAIMKTEAGLRLNKDGTISVLTGCTDMGQGAHTVLPQIAADALGVSMSLMRCETPDTAIVPDSGPTVASRTTMIIGKVMQKCAPGFIDKIFSFVAKKHDVKKESLTIKDDVIYSHDEKIAAFTFVGQKYYEAHGEFRSIERYELPKWVKWDAAKHLGDAYPAYSWACDVAEVSVDVDTYEVTVDKMTLAFDIGKAINPLLLEGNIEGGTLQALGWCLMETSDFKNGKPTHDRLQTYIIPTVKDTPEWNTKIIEDEFSEGPRGAKGVGELPLDGGAPAIANAIYNAVGVRITSLPITPEKIFASLNDPRLR
ncbi:MAG: xanthine dehydrogenase family protein molybdopterin-binding subunit [bacterium]